MPHQENEFERRVRESEAAALRGLPPGKRPVTEQWWWFFGVTAWAWFRLLLWPFDHDAFGGDAVINWLAVVLVLIGLPLFLRERNRGERKRAALRREAEGAAPDKQREQ